MLRTSPRYAASDPVLPLLAHPWRSGLLAAIYAAVALAFVADLVQDEALAFGVFYIPLVCTAVFFRDPRWVWWLAITASALVVIGFFLPTINAEPGVAIANRALSIAAIIATALLVRHTRSIQDRLAFQTTRAQTADRLKADIFANLSHELRTPLNAIIGFSELLLADCRPDQRNALEHLRGGGRRLLATMENLLDLTQIADLQPRAEPTDAADVVRRVADAAQPAAIERDVSLALHLPDTPARVISDTWAVRRIVENLIGNGIKFTEPGGTVTVAVAAAPDRCVVVVEDTGPGMSPEVLGNLGQVFFQADAGTSRMFEGMGTGLALCRRLADAIGAELEFVSEPGRGTTVRLRLPAA